MEKEDNMKTTECIPQKISKLMLGLILMGFALALILIGATLLPVFGFILALPVIALAIYIFRLHLNDQCEIDFSAE